MRFVPICKIVVVLVLIIAASPCLFPVVGVVSLNSCAYAKSLSPKAASAQPARNYHADVCDVRVVRHVDAHPDAWRLCQPIYRPAELQTSRGGFRINGKKDMSDILVTVFKSDGDTWSEEKSFFHAGIKNSYPTLIELAPGDFRAVWDSGTSDTPRTHIHFGKLRIAP